MTRPRARVVAAAVMLAAASAAMAGGRARADAIGPPPADCPAGSVGESSHSGEWCEAVACNTDTDCSGYGDWPEPKRHYVCRQTELCVRTETYTLGGRMPLQPGQPPPTSTRTIGVGACGSDCTAPASCTNVKRCVEENALVGLGRRATSGCGSCAVVRRERAATALLGVAVGCGVLVARIARGVGRRRRRRR